jgi:ligand-binding sensor domain-containing protein
LSKYDKVSNQWTTYIKADSLADDDLKVVKADTKGDIWIGTALGLSVYDPESKEWINYQRKDGLITDYIMDVEIENGSVWIGTDRGVGALDGETRRWQFYGHRDGLSSNFVTSLAFAGEDMWAGTQGGLFRSRVAEYEERRGAEKIRVAEYEERKWIGVGGAFGLSGQLITDLAFDGKDGILWIGTEDGIWRYEPENGKATHYGMDDGLASNCINAISITDDGFVYVGTQRGLSLYKDGIWETVTLDLPSNQPMAGSTENIRALASDGRILWLGTWSGLVKYDREQKRSEIVDIGEGFSRYNIRSICVRDNSLWLGTTSGLLQVSRQNGSLIEEYRRPPVREPFRESSVSNIEFDGDYVWFSNWLASPNGAIIRYDRKTKTWRRFTREDILHDTTVRAPTEVKRILITDKYIWFATDYGVLRYDKKLDIWKRYTMEDGLTSNNMEYMVESTKGIWMSSRDTVIVSRYDKETEKCEAVDIPPVPGHPSAAEWLEYMEADGSDVWFGFWSRFCGVRRYNEDTDTWYHYTWKEGLTKTGAEHIGIDDDRVWVAHGYRGGLSYYDKAEEKWITVPSSRVSQARKLVVTDKSVWIITQSWSDNSVTRYDKVNDEWTVIRPRGGFMGETTELVEDGDYVWFATVNDGVNRFHMASGTWTNFNDRTGLLQNHTNERALKADDRLVWVGTPRGLSMYDKESETWISYTQSETLIGNEVRSVVADERYVWCGTSQGLSRYDKLYGTKRRTSVHELRT